jgi:endonuclease/exonuclease/phosphatase family metal-dependent hydrolase
MSSTALKIVAWNANGLCQHAQEINVFLNMNNIDIMLVSETHLTNKSKFNIRNYNIYQTNHPDGTAHGGTAILIKSELEHNELAKYSNEQLQATTIELKTNTGKLKISSIYCQPKHCNKKEIFLTFFGTLGTRFLVGGDFNAKHTMWGSRLTSTKGRVLLQALQEKKIDFISTGEPTYWPADHSKLPDLIDFFVSKGIDLKRCTINSCSDLSSDHSPISLTIHTVAQKIMKPPKLSSNRTDWEKFRNKLDNLINLRIPLKTEEDIELAVYNLTQYIQEAAWTATPGSRNHVYVNKDKHSYEITELMKMKRKLRKKWQLTRNLALKKELNQLTKKLKYELLEEKNNTVQQYLSELTPTRTTDYDL